MLIFRPDLVVESLKKMELQTPTEAFMAKFCACFRQPVQEVHTLDYRHSSLSQVPNEVFAWERTLEELYVDSNQIRDLPRELFYCHGIRKLCLSDNEVQSIPPAIASLINLEEIDISKNGIVDLPDNIKGCKHLRFIEASVNPLGKLPDGFTQLLNLTELYLNDTFLDYLPGNFGRLSKLKILEVRENHLKQLPRSMARLSDLERLDIGNNDFTELPDVIGSMPALLELWCDSNQISMLPTTIGNLKQLMYFDASKNRIEDVPAEIEGCVSLSDLHLSTNMLKDLPETVGRLSNLTTLKVEDNQLASLPFSIGGLVSLSELNVAANDLDELPPSIGLLRHLRTFYADENFLEELPSELGSCNGLTVLSLRCNKLQYLPDELGRIPRLRVLNVSENQLVCLPFAFTKLKQIQALWLSENQAQPLIPLQTEVDRDTGKRTLTCYLLPQQSMDHEVEPVSDGDSFHPSMWDEERSRRMQIQFEGVEDEGKHPRTTQPYPKEMKDRVRHSQNLEILKSKLPNGDVQWSKGKEVDGGGVDNEAYNKDPPSGSSSPEKVHVELGVNPTASPLMQERHLLYKFDKDKLARDKARMQKEKVENNNTALTPGKDGDKSSKSKSGLPQKSEEKTKSSEKKGKEKSPSKDKEKSSGKDKGKDKSSKKEDKTDGSKGKHEPAQPLATSTPVVGVGGAKPSQSISDFRNVMVSNLGAVRDSKSDYALHQNVSSSRDNLNRDSVNRTPSRENLSMVNYSREPGSRDPGVKTIPYPFYTGYTSGGYHQHNHHHHHSQNHRHRSSGYDSEGGVRGYHQRRTLDYDSETGYKSDNGYKSDSDGYRLQRIQQAMRGDGYASDYGAAKSSRTPNKYGSGYSSDVGDSRRYKGYSHNDYRVPSSRNKGLTYSMAGSGNSHSNGPHVKRTTIRSDELYADQQGQNRSSQGERSSRPGPPVPPRSPSVKSLAKENDEREPGSRDTNVQDVSTRFQPVGRDGSPQRDMRHRGSEDLTSWRRDLYTVLEQKRLKQQGAGSQQPEPQTPVKMEPHHGVTELRRKSAPNMYSPIPSDDDMFHPPPYKPTPPYHPKQHHHLTSDSPDPELAKYMSGQDNKALSSVPEHKASPSRRSSMPQAVESPYSRVVGDRSFDSFPNPNDPPPPLNRSHEMSRYEDVAIYKSQEPPSQVSSSTDSGYGHGHHIYERVNELGHRISASPMNAMPPPSRAPPSPPRQHRLLTSQTPPRNSPNTPVSRESTPSRGLDGFRPPEKSSTPRPASDSPAPSGYHTDSPRQSSYAADYGSWQRMSVTITKNPGLGFSIAGGLGAPGNPYRPEDLGIFVTKVHPDGAAANKLRPGDKIITANGADFTHIDHSKAVMVLKTSMQTVQLVIERDVIV
ncbi:erbin-like isoform X2 [Lineus longissimus]|uniref:erbin-like isoform X2 n=2 Tax=Lineus longissimus TaxID=88925 RepID=UPI00315DE7AE